MRYVAQREADDCAVACFAMVCEISYEQARARFKLRKLTGGISCEMLAQELAKEGFATARIFPEKGEPWPMLLTTKHIARVKTDRGPQRMHHFVVVDCNGRVFDPVDRHIKDLGEYIRVLDIACLVAICKESI